MEKISDLVSEGIHKSKWVHIHWKIIYMNNVHMVEVMINNSMGVVGDQCMRWDGWWGGWWRACEGEGYVCLIGFKV